MIPNANARDPRRRVVKVASRMPDRFGLRQRNSSGANIGLFPGYDDSEHDHDGSGMTNILQFPASSSTGVQGEAAGFTVIRDTTDAASCRCSGRTRSPGRYWLMRQVSRESRTLGCIRIFTISRRPNPGSHQFRSASRSRIVSPSAPSVPRRTHPWPRRRRGDPTGFAAHCFCR